MKTLRVLINKQVQFNCWYKPREIYKVIKQDLDYTTIETPRNMRVKSFDCTELPSIEDASKIGLKDALVSRGRRVGMLKAKCPPMNTYGSAVWQAIQFYSNHYKMGMGHMMFMDKDKTQVYKHIIEIGKTTDLSNFDRDGNILRELNLM